MKIENAIFLGLALMCLMTDLGNCRIIPVIPINIGTQRAAQNTCGNSLIQSLQQCDDGNKLDGDGCSSSCIIEDDFICDTTVSPSVCQRIKRCGNFIIQLDEQCDEPQKIIECNSNCTLLHNFFYPVIYTRFETFRTVNDSGYGVMCTLTPYTYMDLDSAFKFIAPSQYGNQTVFLQSFQRFNSIKTIFESFLALNSMPLGFYANTLGDFIKIIISKSTFEQGIGYSWNAKFFDYETAYEPGYYNSKILMYVINDLFKHLNLVAGPCFSILDIAVPEPVYCGNQILETFQGEQCDQAENVIECNSDCTVLNNFFYPINFTRFSTFRTIADSGYGVQCTITPGTYIDLNSVFAFVFVQQETYKIFLNPLSSYGAFNEQFFADFMAINQISLNLQTNTIGDLIKVIISRSTYEEGVGYSWSARSLNNSNPGDIYYQKSINFQNLMNGLLFQKLNEKTYPCFTLLDIVLLEPSVCGNSIVEFGEQCEDPDHFQCMNCQILDNFYYPVTFHEFSSFQSPNNTGYGVQCTFLPGQYIDFDSALRTPMQAIQGLNIDDTFFSTPFQQARGTAQFDYIFSFFQANEMALSANDTAVEMMKMIVSKAKFLFGVGYSWEPIFPQIIEPGYSEGEIQNNFLFMFNALFVLISYHTESCFKILEIQSIHPPLCGNQILESGEQCDDLPTVIECNMDCTLLNNYFYPVSNRFETGYGILCSVLYEDAPTVLKSILQLAPQFETVISSLDTQTIDYFLLIFEVNSMPLGLDNTLSDFIKLVISQSIYEFNVGYTWDPVWPTSLPEYQNGFVYMMNHLFEVINEIQPCLKIVPLPLH